MQPAHSLVVFLPLCDLNEENGPTAFLPGSHQRWTSDALEAEADAPGSSTAGAPAILDVDAGDAIRLSDAARGRREPLDTRAADPVPRLRAAVV